MKLRWTDAARNDVEEYAAFIRLDNLAAADRWTAEILARAKQAARFPGLGRVVRQFIIYSHRLIYRVKGEVIEVVRVWHASRRLRKRELGEEE